jgi:hypothetical protein
MERHSVEATEHRAKQCRKSMKVQRYDTAGQGRVGGMMT